MLCIGFLNQSHLVQRECIAALSRVPHIRLVVIDIVENPSLLQIQTLTEQLAKQSVTCLFTINEWGLDTQQALSTYCTVKDIVHINWFVDDPFFLETMYAIPLTPSHNRIDFVSDRGYVQKLRERGFSAHFLPLATDPALFTPRNQSERYQHRICFVGNSYKEEFDGFLTTLNIDLEPYISGIKKILDTYSTNTHLSLDQAIETMLTHYPTLSFVQHSQTIFLSKFFIGYMFRKQLITNLCTHYPDCMVFGDALWTEIIPRHQVSTAVGYYINLCQTYQSTAINIDINRTVIRDGFTQRIFDCSACGSAIITSSKPCVEEFFETSGPSQDMVMFTDAESFMDLTRYYLAHEKERQTIALRAQKKVCSLHTYDHRINSLMQALL